MRYLITGGLGFIGSNLIRYLFNKYPTCEILNVDCCNYCSNPLNESGLAEKYAYTFSKTNIADAYIARLLEEFKPNIIINLAAQTHVDRSITNPKEFIETDVNGVFNLVYQSMKYGIEKFIHISTDEVYGSREIEADENSRLNPTSPYAASKAAGDLLLLSYVKTYNFPAILIRPCNNYGPRQYPEKLVPMAITQLLQSKKILLHGEGKEVREWLYVDDCCRAIDKITQYGKIGQIYNVGSGDRINNINVIRQIIRSMFGRVDGIDSLIRRVPNRPGNDKRYAINSEKTISECGEYKVADFSIGMKITTDWYTLNKNWWSNLQIDLSSNLYNNTNYLR